MQAERADANEQGLGSGGVAYPARRAGRRVPTLAVRGVLVALYATMAAGVGGCIGSPEGGAGASASRASSELRRFPLDQLPVATISANGRPIRVWLATTPATQAEGLMHVPASEIADDQGMLFIFPDEAERSFWMRNTIIALDVAFARRDGTVVRTHTMPPLTLRSFPSGQPAMFALEMKAGSFERLGISEGTTLVIPADVFKVRP